MPRVTVQLSKLTWVCGVVALNHLERKISRTRVVRRKFAEKSTNDQPVDEG